MRWSCPHCGVNLAVTDEKLGNGWSFSRCYKCGGFALVRRSDVNLIKVDRAPTGEKVLLPEATEEPMLSATATQNLARYVEANQARNEATMAAQAHANAILQNAAAQQAAGATSSGIPIIRRALRRARPERAQAAAAPQAATPPSTAPGAPNKTATPPRPPGATGDLSALVLPDPLPEEPSRESSRVLPIAIAFAGAMSIASGIYLYIQGQALWHKARTAAGIPHKQHEQAQQPAQPDVINAPALALESADRVHQNAMAPVRTEIAAPHANESGQSAAAPVKEATTAMTVTIKVKNAHLHSGPGMGYPVIGTADNGKTYPVADWRDRWFRIVLPAQEKQTAQSAWIRNDLVQR